MNLRSVMNKAEQTMESTHITIQETSLDMLVEQMHAQKKVIDKLSEDLRIKIAQQEGIMDELRRQFMQQIIKRDLGLFPDDWERKIKEQVG